MNKKRQLGHRLGTDRFSAVYLWILFLVVFGIWSPSEFLTAATAQSVATQQAIAGIIAIAVLIPLVCGQYDLSVGGNANLTGVVAVLLQTHYHWGVVASVLVAVAVGIAIGFVNGFLVVGMGVNSFIATLGMGSILSAVLVIVTGGLEPTPPESSGWGNFTQHPIFGTQIVVLYVLIIALVAWWFLDYTPGGRYLYAIGGNADASRLSGVRVSQWSWVSLTISGGIAGLGGILFTSLTGPSLTFGSTLLLPAFAAAFLGSTQLQPGRFNVWGTIIAIYVLATGVQGLQLVSGQQWLGDMFNGVALILAVALAAGRQGRKWRLIRRKSSTPPPTEAGLIATRATAVSTPSADDH